MSIEILFLFPLFVITSWRTARAVVEDQLFSDVRDFIWRRWHKSGFYVENRHVGTPEMSPVGPIAKVKAWPFRRWAQATEGGIDPDEPIWIPVTINGEDIKQRVRESKFGYLFGCMDCMPLYTAAATVFTYYGFTPGTPITHQILLWISTAAIATVVEWKV